MCKVINGWVEKTSSEKCVWQREILSLNEWEVECDCGDGNDDRKAEYVLRSEHNQLSMK